MNLEIEAALGLGLTRDSSGRNTLSRVSTGTVEGIFLLAVIVAGWAGCFALYWFVFRER